MNSLIFTVFKETVSERLIIVNSSLEFEAKGVFISFIISSIIGYIVSLILNKNSILGSDKNTALNIVFYVSMIIFTVILSSFICAWIMDYFCVLGREVAFEQLAIDQDFVKMGETVDSWKSLGSVFCKPIAVLISFIWSYPLNRFFNKQTKTQK